MAPFLAFSAVALAIGLAFAAPASSSARARAGQTSEVRVGVPRELPAGVVASVYEQADELVGVMSKRRATSSLLDDVDQNVAIAQVAQSMSCDLGNDRSGLEAFFNALLVLGLAALGMRLKV